MFRIESYVTSLILSYVDRFIKNFRRQDAQVSLWEGDGIFHNLDLDLEALEKELQSPFTFISGHIHELLIHVPWTRIGSEPVSVTINTIECVVKLKPPGSEGTQSPSKSRKSQIEDEVAPPSSMSAFISKILYNVSITCNNIILKYVEEDIVFSMNVKTLSMLSVNGNWEPEFLDMNPMQQFLRKLMTVSDITICLDKRNASGRIESFLEPLLYRCSMTIRLCRFQPNAKSRKTSFSRLDIFCSALSFTISEPQVTMMMRLLILALSLRQKPPPSDAQECLPDNENKNLRSGSSIDEGVSDGELQSWSGWLWSWVPQILPQNDMDESSHSPLLANFSHRLHLGIYIDSLSCVIKLENNETSKSSKRVYQPCLQVWLNGSFFNLISVNTNWSNAQFGVSHISIEPVGDCCCGSSEMNQVPYFSSGRIQQDFLNGSLFKNSSVIPEDIPIEWNAHLSLVTETSLLERTPALAVDYLFVVENTHVLDINEEEHEINEEKVLTRIIIGPSLIRLNSGLIHRLQRIHFISTLYDYQPYSFFAARQDSMGSQSALPKLNEEELLCVLGGNIPQNVVQFTAFNPVLEIYAASHPPVSSVRQRKISKVQKRVLPGSSDVVPPRFTLEWQCLDGKMTTPLRLKQIVYTLLSLREKLPNSLLNALQTFISVKVLGLGSSLIVNPGKTLKILEINNVSINVRLSDKELIENTEEILKDVKFEIESIILTCSKASVIVYCQILTSLMFSNHKQKLYQCLKLIHDTSLVTDVQILPGAVLLDVSIFNVQTEFIETNLCHCAKFSVHKLQAFIEKLASDCNTCYKAMIFGAPLVPENNEPIVEVVLQVPITDEQRYAPILCFVIRHMQMSVDPLLYAWLLYQPSTTGLPSKKPGQNSSSGLLTRKVSESNLSASQASKASIPPATLQQDSALSSSGRDTATPSIVTHSNILKQSDSTSKTSWTDTIVSKFSVWKGIVITGDVSQLIVYFPRTTFEDVRSDKSDPISMEQIIQLYLSKTCPPEYSKIAHGAKNLPDFSSLEVVIFKLPSISLRCCSTKTSIMEYIHSLPVKLPETLWTPGKLNFPLSLEIADLHCMTFSNGIDTSLLKPISASCTVGIAPRSATNDESLSSLGLIVHCDMSPVTVSISELQVKMLTELLLASLAVYRVLFNSKLTDSSSPLNEDIPIRETTAPVVGSEESRSASAVTKDISSKLTVAVDDSSQNVKLTAWLQLVLARFSLILSTVPSSSSSENLKLVLDIEDVITSMDIQSVYYKVKLKVSNACVQYHTRESVKHPWKLGKFLGLVMRSHNADSTPEIPSAIPASSASGPFAEDSTNLSRFLVATLTIASCNHLHSKITNANSSSIFSEVIPHQSLTDDRFITELILKIQPIDFIFSPSIMGKFLNIILPLINISFDKSIPISTPPPTAEVQSQGQSSLVYNLLRYNFPMLYIDMMNIRLIVPQMLSQSDKSHQDCFIFELDSITVAPQPDNPLCRNPLRADLYHIAEKHHILHTPGSLIEDRQYQIDIKNIRLNTGFWSEMEHLLRSYQSFDSISPRTVSQPNPAVLWNQGQNPDNSTTSNLTLQTIVESFNITINVAPPMFFFSSPVPILVCGSSAEINVLSEIKLFLSMNQLKLISSLQDEISACIVSRMKSSTSTVSYPRLLKSPIPGPSVRKDSGLESIDGDSGVCSLKNVDKSDANTGTKVLYTIHEALSIIQCQSVFSDSSPISSGGFSKRTKLNYIPVEILLTAKVLSLSLFKECKSKSASTEAAEIQPIFFIGAVEPHCFIKYYSDSYFCQASVFDFSVLFAKPNYTANRLLSNEVDFPVKFLETAEGQRCINGVSPSFFTSKYSQHHSKQPKIEIELGRPIRLNLSTAIIKHIQRIFESLKVNDYSAYSSATEPTSCDGSSNSKTIDLSSDRQESSLRTKTNNFSSISVNTQQLTFALYGPQRKKIILSIEKIGSLLKIISLLNHSVDRIHFTLNLGSVIVTISKLGQANEVLLNPWSSLFTLTLSWEPWFHSCSKPLTQITVESDILAVNFCLDRIRNAQYVLSEYVQLWEQYVQLSKSNSGSKEDYCEQSSEKNQSTEEEQHYKDDLRAGAFQYIDQVSELPSAYQVVFDKKGIHGAPSMSWRYPQPRCITKLEVSPVPFTNLQEKLSSNSSKDVDCALEYYSDVHGQFIEYTLFSLSESKTQRVHLPMIEPLPVIASCWRIKLVSPDSGNNHLIDVRCLAGIIRIDSYYSPAFLPRVQASLCVSSIQIEFWNTMRKTFKMPQPLNRYTLDEVVPGDHCFAKLSFEQSKFGFMFWENIMTGEIVAARPRLDVLNYASLCMQCVVEPFLLRASSYFFKERGNNPHLSIVTNHMNVWIGPGILQSLNIAHQLYYQNQSDDEDQVQVLFTPFAVCNNTNEAIKFGQVGTSEVIILQPLQVHMYSWRSARSRPFLKFTLASSNWLWSNPVSVIEYKCSFETVLSEEGESVVIVIGVKDISPTLTQVSIDGQLQLCNLTGRVLECAVVSRKDGTCIDNRLMALSPGVTPPSILQRTCAESCIRLSFPSVSNPGSSGWSGLVPIHPQAGLQKSHWLVKVPFKTRTQYRSIWCRAIWDAVKINETMFHRTLVILMPLVSIKSILPCKATVEIETPQHDSVSATVVGRNIEHELDCPGTTHDTHNLSFRLEGSLPAFSPKVAVSYNSPEGGVSPEPSALPPFDDLLSELCLAKTDGTSSEWPFIGPEYNNFHWVQSDQPDTITHIKTKCKSDKYFCNSLLVELKPWALLVNTSGYEISIKCSNETVCSLVDRSVIAPPFIESTFQLCIDFHSKNFRSSSLQLSSDQSFYIPRISGLIPLSGSVSVTVDCDSFVSLVTITSSQTEDVRILHLKSSYIISNNSSCNVTIAPVIVRSKCKAFRFPVSTDVPESAVHLPAEVEVNQRARPLTFWAKIKADGKKENTVELYLIVHINDKISCPILVSSIVDKQILPVIFSSEDGNEEPVSVSITAHTKDNQTFFSIWDQPYPDIVIYNNTKLSLLFTRMTEQKQPVHETSDWQWTLVIASNTAVNYYFPSGTSSFFALALNNRSSSVEWSECVHLSPCISRLISLPNHKHEIKLTILKSAYMMKIFVESASQSEISAQDIRLRLVQSKNVDRCSKELQYQDRIPQHEPHKKDYSGVIAEERLDSPAKSLAPFKKSDEDLLISCQSEDALSRRLELSEAMSAVEDQLLCDLGVGQSSPSVDYEPLPMTPKDTTFNLHLSQRVSEEETTESSVSAHVVTVMKKQKNLEDQVLKSSLSTGSANLNVTCFMAGLTVTFIKDDFICSEKEVAALSFDHLCFLILPLSVAEGKSNELHVNLSFGGMQVDNQEFSQGGYDFPVVIVKAMNDKEEIISPTDIAKQPAQWLVEEARMKGQIAIFVNSVVDVTTYKTWVVEDVSVNISSFQAYIEDTYFLFLKKYLLSLTKWTSNNTYNNPRKSTYAPVFWSQEKHLRKRDRENDENLKKSSARKSNGNVAVSTFENADKVSEISYNVSSNGSNVDLEQPKENPSTSKPAISGSHHQPVESLDEIIFNFDTIENVEQLTNENKSAVQEFLVRQRASLDGIPVPESFYLLSREIAMPLRLRSLKISPVNILVSVHTSTKFYIALDHSPLSFSEFKRFNLVTSHFRLGSAISLHYFLNAIYGTGWALGALELWGAPGGLARSVGAGVRDLITLPITGSIEQGARGFLVGVAHGCASLMKHVTAGTLSSVTKFAASWARTLDRLTLEPEDLRHAEALRRSRPQGVTEGLVQGLTEFGISLLGAIGGLAHHPLQYAIRDNPERSLVNSIGLGLVGVITRPLSGAAELVALTGEGLLSGVGWNQTPKAKQQAITQNRIICTNSSLKYQWQLLNMFEELLYSAEVTHQMDTNTYKHVMLVLTKESLYIFDCENDEQLKKISLEELFETQNENDPTLITFRIKSHEKQLEEMNQARVLEFVRDSQRLAGQQSSTSPLIECSGEETVSFFINPQSRNHFIVFFNLAKRHSQNRGFPLF
ncbi:unnamed protein product [Bemisia tabaci]|uniref:Chorein N-terminal domain-containing protein n=1 Tax=Bemisia tabaci TaxID=7038 RepID=A0A9P0F6S6_BEMTA|nr:unnamed protein product [Bemisia tabaci]